MGDTDSMNTKFLPLAPEHQQSSHAVPRGAREAIPNNAGDNSGTDLGTHPSLDDSDPAGGHGPPPGEQEREPGPGAGPGLQYDPHFTDRVIAATGAGAHPRLARVMPSLVRHLHDFAREVGLTVEEWTAGVEMINEAGRMSDAKRNETGLLCDVLGLESLVDEITTLKQQQQQQQQQGPPQSDITTFALTPTPSAILGPFYRADAPLLPLGASILRAPTRENLDHHHDGTPNHHHRHDDPQSQAAAAEEDMKAALAAHSASARDLARVRGRVLSARTGRAVPAGATVEVWQSAPGGLYEQQDALQADMNLRGRFIVAPSPPRSPAPSKKSSTSEAEADGRGEADPRRAGTYGFVCLRPTPYPVPDDGPAGRLLALLDRQPRRPGHLHFVVCAPGHATLTTQVFDGADPLVADDSVFAVKRALCVAFEPFGGDGVAGGAGEHQGDRADGIDWEAERRRARLPLPKWTLDFDFSLVEL